MSYNPFFVTLANEFRKPKLQRMDNYRKIIHIDMDCFFAAVERLDNPSLEGLPIAVGHDSERGVVSTASYEARRFGVHSAQSIRMAKKLCPELHIVEPRISRYKEVSASIHNIFHRYTDTIEPISLDEAFLDVTSNKRNMELAVDIAKEIKDAIHNELGLTASAGVSYCKMLAKIASDYNKPNGLCVIHPDRAIEFLDKLKIERLWLVGPKTAHDMHELGIFTVRQLRAQSLATLTRLFGKRGPIFYNYARGIDESPVETEQERKSVSCETTFEKDLSVRSVVIIELYHITLELVNRLAKSGFIGRTLTLKVKYADFTQITRSATSEKPLKTKKEILPLAKKLLSKVEFNMEYPIRLLGLGVGNNEPEQENDKTAKSKWEELKLPFKD